MVDAYLDLSLTYTLIRRSVIQVRMSHRNTLKLSSSLVLLKALPISMSYLSLRSLNGEAVPHYSIPGIKIWITIADTLKAKALRNRETPSFKLGRRWCSVMWWNTFGTLDEIGEVKYE